MQTQGQGHNSSSCDLAWNFEIFIKLYSMLLSVKGCAGPMRAQSRLKVTLQEVSEYDQEIQKPQTTDQPTAPRGKID